MKIWKMILGAVAMAALVVTVAACGHKQPPAPQQPSSAPASMPMQGMNEPAK